MSAHLPALDHGVMDPAPVLYVIRIHGHLGATVLFAFPALVRSELRDGLRVLVERLAHVGLLSTIPGFALGPGDGKPGGLSRRSGLDLVLPGSGPDEPAA